MENVHFVAHALDFPCIPFEYKDNTMPSMEIQRKWNGNPSHARQCHSARSVSEKHVKLIFFIQITFPGEF